MAHLPISVARRIDAPDGTPCVVIVVGIFSSFVVFTFYVLYFGTSTFQARNNFHFMNRQTDMIQVKDLMTGEIPFFISLNIDSLYLVTFLSNIHNMICYS